MNSSASATRARARTALPTAVGETPRQPWDDAAAGRNNHTKIIRQWLRDATQLMLDPAQIKAVSRVLDTALSESEQRTAWADIEAKLNVLTTTSGWVEPNELLLAIATAPYR